MPTTCARRSSSSRVTAQWWRWLLLQSEQQTAEDERGRSRQVKAAKNQSLFREVNERVKQIGEQPGARSYAENAICECANPECSEEIALEAGNYESVREHSTFFAVAPRDEHV